MAEDAGKRAFGRELRRALQHLYDPAALRRGPLIQLFGLGRRDDPASALQRLLLDAIQALKPTPDAPAHSNARRLHYILSQRYAGQFAEADIAANLAIGGRHVRRLHLQALDSLADRLWTQYKPSGEALELRPPAPAAPPTQEQELDWLTRSYPAEAVDLAPLMQALLKTLGPLFERSQLQVECALPAELPRLAVQPTATRQAILNVLTAAARTVPGGRLRIEAEVGPRAVTIAVRSIRRRSGPPSSLPPKVQESLQMAERLLKLSAGALDVGPSPFQARLVLPTARQVTALVVDDNADALRLFECYLEGSRYRFVGLRDPRQALAAAAECHPQIIVIDVMLPGVDGWELLQRLREHPQTRSVPILICTILPEDGLALTLGAAGFIRKPVTQNVFLAALDRAVP